MAAEALTLLRSVPLFAGLPAREVEAVAGTATETGCEAHQYVFREGDPALWFCIVRRGRVKIVRQSPGGREVILELLGPGEVFGGVAVIERRPYPATAQAVEPSVVLRIPAEAMIGLADRHPALIRELTRLVGQRLRSAHDAVKSLALDPVAARLAATLLRLADREGVKRPQGLELPFHIPRQNLADMSGTTVETTIRILGRWRREALVAQEGDHLVLEDLEALRALAAGAEA
jgi:CRP/FNR family transcriptional regulator